MKKKRRIEITTFRRRTTIIVRGFSGDNMAADQSESLQLALAELATSGREPDIDQLRLAGQATLAQRELSKSTELKSKPNQTLKDKSRKWISRVTSRRNKS